MKNASRSLPPSVPTGPSKEAERWQLRKTLPGNRAEGPAHLTRDGHAKLSVLYNYWLTKHKEVGDSSKPILARLLEHGLDLSLSEVGIDPKKALEGTRGAKLIGASR